jgi:hypothetical protein
MGISQEARAGAIGSVSSRVLNTDMLRPGLLLQQCPVAELHGDIYAGAIAADQ